MNEISATLKTYSIGKLKFAVEEAMKAQRGRRGIALFFL